MSPSKLGVFASLALAASAVLIPPTMDAEAFGNDMASASFATDPFKRSVALECPGCAFATYEDEVLSWEEGAGNAFLLDFEIGRHEDALEVAGVQLYPPTINPVIGGFHVTQIDPHHKHRLNLRVTGFHAHFSAGETISEEGTELLPITLQITSVEGVAVNPQELKINLLKDSDGRLMIASFNMGEVGVENTPAPEEEEECKEWPLLCKWKDIVAERIEMMKKMGKGKGCNKKPHGHSNPMEEENFHGKPPHRFRPGRPHPHHHHRPHHMGHGGHRHHPHHRVHMFLRRALFTVLIPIVIGIFAGTVTYLLGMAVGCLIAVVIAKVRGQGYERIALEEDVEQPESVTKNESEGEKEGYAELPAYDAPPVYEEASQKEVDESK